MKKMLIILLAAACCGIAGRVQAVGNNSLTLYGTYWDTENAGYGLGLKYGKSLLDIVSVDGRGGYVVFDDAADTTMVPLEVALNLAFPGPISPYAGVGLGYYFIDNPVLDNAAGYFGQVGLELTVFKIGAMAELRYMDLEENYFDELSLNIGVLWRF